MTWAIQKMRGQRITAAMVAITGFIALGCLTFCTSGCAAWPAISAATSGGVTLYKNAKESGPKVELVIFKAEFHHTIVTNTK